MPPMLDALAAAALPPPPGAPAPAPGDGSGVNGFPALLLGAAAPPGAPLDGQAAADDGKDLPDGAEDHGYASTAEPSLDPMLLWLPVDLPRTLPAPALGGVASAASTIRPAALPSGIPVVPPAADPSLTSLAGATWQAVTPERWTGELPTASEQAVTPPSTPSTMAVNGPQSPAPAPSPTVPPASPPTPLPAIQPARQAFAAAFAMTDGERPQRIARRSEPAEQPLTATLEALGAALPLAVAATGDAQHAPFDLTRDADLGRLIDHIEQVRDQADAGDTRMRLSPDALGTVDVAVRRDGDRVHVHFTADQAQTRTLLTEAQPRLQALADARGLKLGDASIAGGQSGQRQDRAPERFATTATGAAAAPAVPTITDPAPDARLA